MQTCRLPPEAAQLTFMQQCDGQLTFPGPKLVLPAAPGGLTWVQPWGALPCAPLCSGVSPEVCRVVSLPSATGSVFP